MACRGSRGDGMKVSESSEKKKSKTKKRKLVKSGIRVSKQEKMKKRKKTHKKKSTKKNCAKLIEKEMQIFCGGRVVAYDRDDPNTCDKKPGKYLISLVDLAIDFYNKNNSTDYRMVHLVRATCYGCQGALYKMTMTAKLPDQDDVDAITLEAVVYEGIDDRVVRSVHVLDAPPLSHVST